MCGICGCSETMDLQESPDKMTIVAHSHGDEPMHVHIGQAIFAKNDQFAEKNQTFFTDHNLLALNILSSPGSGKTTLLTKTIMDLQSQIPCAVIVGDQEGDVDAQLIRQAGIEALQVNTGKMCHLDAHQVGHALEKLSIRERMMLFIENVGNLVCPAFFNLGEHYKIVLLSVTEGDNKPLKYPDMFYSADLMIITKIDLLPYVDFDVARCIEYAHRINSKLETLALSATSLQGLSPWYHWLLAKHQAL